MSKFFKLTITLTVCLFLVNSLLAVETGKIEGKVTDDEGLPLPGVTVTAKSPALQGTRAVITGRDGSFRLALLPVGTYELTYELQGFATRIEKGYFVRLGMTLSIQVAMTLATVEEEITVVAESPLIDKTQTDTSYRMNAQDLARVPIQGRTIQELVSYTPGVTGVRADTLDGTSAPNAGGGQMPSFRGEGGEGNNWLVDGLSSTGPRINDQGVRINFDSWEEVQIISDGFTPDFESAVGGVINIVTKSGGNVFHGEVAALIRDHNLRAERRDQLSIVAAPDTSKHQYYANLGGPIIRDKLWFFLSDNFFRTADDSVEKTVEWLTFPAGSRRKYTNNVFGKLTFAAHANHTLSLSGTLDKFLSQTGGTGLPERYTKKTYTDYSYRLNYKGILSQDTLLEVAFGQQNQDLIEKPLEDNYGPPEYYFLDITQLTNNAEGDRINVEKRTDFSLRLTQYLEAGTFGNHELGVGVSYYETYGEDGANWTGRDFDLWPGNKFENGVSLSWNSPGEPDMLYEYGFYGFNNTTKGFGMYLKDKISFDRFTLMLGVRSETQKLYDDLDKVIWSWGIGDFLSPRASLAIDLLGDGNNILKFGFGIFSDTVTTRVLEWFNSRAGMTFRDYEWIGLSNPSDVQLKESANWSFVHEQSPETTPFDFNADIKPPKTYKYLVEFDRRLGPNWALKIRGIYQKTVDLLDDVALWKDTAWWLAYDGTDEPDGWWFWELGNYEDKRRDYRAIEVEVNGRIADRFMLNASYTRSEAKGTNPGQFELGPWASNMGSGYHVGVFGDHVKIPEDNPYYFLDEWTAGLGGVGHGDEGWYGFLPYSVDHMVKVFSSYLAPNNFIFTLGFEWLSGYHWAKIGFQELYGDYMTFPEGRGVRTTPAHAYVDLSAQKDFILPQGFTVGLRLNVYNLLNTQTAISYVKADTPLFGDVYGRQDPRWLQFHVMIKF